tara:strand:+ start:2039 stop:2275 length:237 start_codon:yes stop_codon:yes gene_type:complete
MTALEIMQEDIVEKLAIIVAADKSGRRTGEHEVLNEMDSIIRRIKKNAAHVRAKRLEAIQVNYLKYRELFNIADMKEV